MYIYTERNRESERERKRCAETCPLQTLRARRACLTRGAGEVSYLTQSIYEAVLQTSTPPQIRPFILEYYYCKQNLWICAGIDFGKTTSYTLFVR